MSRITPFFGGAVATFVATEADDTVALNAFLASAPGVTKRLVGSFTVSGTLQVGTAGTLIDLSQALITSTLTSTKLINVTAEDVTIFGGKIVGPSTFDATNTTWAHGVIWVAGARCTVESVTLVNVHKVGIGIKEVPEVIVKDCRIYGNFPNADYTGVNTVHAGIGWDPGAFSSGGAPIITGNHIHDCVQGALFGNYGTGAGYGPVVTGNRFYGCHNHGLYSSGGIVAGDYSDNTFYFCQVPIACTGQGHRVADNVLWTSTTGGATTGGGNRNQTGISMRDSVDCEVIDNVIAGDNTAGNVAVDLTGTTIQRVRVAGNIINMAGSGSGLPAIRAGSGASTTTMTDVVVENNTIRSSGQVAGALISLAVATGSTGLRNAVNDNQLVVVGNSHGISLTRQACAKVKSNTIATEYDAATGQTIIRVQLVSVVDSVVKGNIYTNTAAWGANVTLHGTRESDAGCDRNILGPNFIRDDLTKAVSSTEVVQNTPTNASMIGVLVGEYVAASSLGTLSGKVEVRDSKGAVKGYTPVYTTIT
jgi:hypothetical protein